MSHSLGTSVPPVQCHIRLVRAYHLYNVTFAWYECTTCTMSHSLGTSVPPVQCHIRLVRVYHLYNVTFAWYECTTCRMSHSLGTSVPPVQWLILCLLLRVAGSVDLDLSSILFYPASFWRSRRLVPSTMPCKIVFERAKLGELDNKGSTDIGMTTVKM